MADLNSKQVARAKQYGQEFSTFLTAYYKLIGSIGRVADAGFIWDDAVIHGDPALTYVDAAQIVAAEALMTALATYMASGGRRQILEAMCPS